MINTTDNTAQDFKYQLREKLRTAYYTNTRSQSVTSSDPNGAKSHH